jgi:hypothetical protein
VLERVADLAREARVPLDEAGEVTLGEAEQVVVDEHLAVRVAARADADRRHCEPSRHFGSDRCGDGLENDGERAGVLERERALDQLCGGCGRLALRLEAAELRGRLGRQADVPHDRDARVDDRLHSRDHRACALELDRVRAGLLDEADRVLECLFVGDLEGAERHVADDDRMPCRAHDGARHEQHLLHRHRDGRALVAEDDHRRRVADEDDLDARVLGESRSRRVVGGDHDDLLAALLHGGELGQGELSLGRCAHFVSPSRITLSIKRVLPTRTAAARTRWPLKFASST